LILNTAALYLAPHPLRNLLFCRKEQRDVFVCPLFAGSSAKGGSIVGDIRKISIILLVFLIGSWMALPLAQAQVYKWTDQEGTIHFVDDRSKIPPEYQDKIEKEYPFKAKPEENQKEDLAKEGKTEEKAAQRPN
jgi:hypothetical protein